MNIEEFIKRHTKIYIYGSSEEHDVLVDYYQSKGYKIDGFVVSDNLWKKKENVYKLSEVLKNKDGLGIIIAVLDKYYNEILPLLINGGVDIDDIFFLDIGNRNYIYTLFGKEIEYPSVNYNEVKVQYFEYIKSIISVLHNDEYNMYCGHFNLGDLVFAFRMKDSFEYTYGARLNYIINKRHECLAHICNIDNYSLVDKIELKNIDDIPIELRETIKVNMFERLLSGVPLKGTLFTVPFGGVMRRMFNESHFCDHFSQWLDIEKDRIETPELLECSEALTQKLSFAGVTDIHKVILLAPEANSMKLITKDIWHRLIDGIKKDGYFLITNCIKEENYIPGTIHMDLSLEELLELGGNCNSVYSLRSGLCDCLAGIGERLHVIYWDDANKEYFSLNRNFNIDSLIDEKLVLDYM